MSIMKSIQVLAESTKSFEDAIDMAVRRTSKTVKDVRSANVNNQSCVVENGEVKKYRVNVQITFAVGD